ncbi:MAG TPA: FHA domain-containing protein [Fimbriimonas sp.]
MRSWGRATCALLAFAPLASFAQKSVSVEFPDIAEREVWVASAADPAPRNVVPAKATAVDVPVPSVDPGAMLFALDKASGNVAMTPVAKAKGKWTVKAYDRIGSVAVAVTHGGSPVAAAQVELQDPKQKHSEFLDPSSNGTATFYAVAPGQLKVTVRYKSEGKNAAPVTQLFTIGLQRPELVPTLSVALPEKAETVGATPSAAPARPASDAEKKEKAMPDPSPIGRFIVYLLGIPFAIAVVYFAIQFMKKNQDLVTTKLEDLGVQIPKPGTASDGQPADLPAPIPPPAPEPPQKIVLDDAAPDILGAPATVPVAAPMAAVATGQPRLLNDQGDELPLEEGELTVGREAGTGLSLPDESTVSRRHATLTRSGSQVVLRDLGSTNGTYVNGVRLQGEATLKPGDTVQFGAVRFRYEA